VNRLLDTLEAHYGPQEPAWPTDPYLFLVWWHCGIADPGADRIPANFEARTRAYQLPKCHGQQLCRAFRPKCNACPASSFCAFVKRSSAIKSS